MGKPATMILSTFLFLLTAKAIGQELSAEQQEAVEIIKALDGNISTAKDAKGSTIYKIDISHNSYLLDADLALLKRFQARSSNDFCFQTSRPRMKV